LRCRERANQKTREQHNAGIEDGALMVSLSSPIQQIG
jgi:hypothetical protein